MSCGVEGAKPHIGIIGAGASGLRCADVLLRHGFRVTVLEGRDRLGGRMHQKRLSCNGRLVDVGPNWIHGPADNNPIADLARRTGTVVSSFESDACVFDERGNRLARDTAAADYAAAWDILTDAYAYSEQHSAEIGAERSLLDFFRENVARRIPETVATPGDDADDAETRRRRVLQLAALWGNFVGSPVERQSLKFFWLENCINEESLFCLGTYCDIAGEIARPVREGARIEYQTTISGIGGRDATTGKVVLSATDGRTFEFNDVVVTAPLGWLKKNLGAFTPCLPERLCDAIQSIGYGCLEKVYISFPRAFWSMPEADDGLGFTNFEWLAPAYAPDSNPEQWFESGFSLGKMPGSTEQPTLLFYFNGPQSEYITSKVRSLATEGEKEAFLYSFFAPYYSRLPNYDPTSPDCRPNGAISTDWLHDDLAGNGSYGNFQVGLRDGDGDVRAMQAGVPERGIWFAGEHAAPLDLLGTVTGAYLSAERVAERIAQAYGG